MVNLCALVAIGGQHLSFFVGVLDGDYFLLLLLFEGPNDDSSIFVVVAFGPVLLQPFPRGSLFFWCLHN